MSTAYGPGYCAATPRDGFVRYKGDDWDGANFLLFQYGTLVPGAVTTNSDGTTTTAPPTVTPIDITGCQPVGTLILQSRTFGSGLRQGTTPQGTDLFTLTVDAGTARIVNATQGLFGFCPRRDITSQIPAMAHDATMADATLLIAGKLIDSLGNLGTIDVIPILVRQS